MKKTKKINSDIHKNERVNYMISPSAESRIELSPSGAQLFSMIKIGMTESKVLHLSSKVCIERGYVLKSDHVKRLYIHLSRNAQIWVELTQDNLDSEPVVTAKSSIETKSTWKKYRNNVLKISDKQNNQ